MKRWQSLKKILSIPWIKDKKEPQGKDGRKWKSLDAMAYVQKKLEGAKAKVARRKDEE